MAKLNVFIFNWNSGGYNTVQAATKREAREKIKKGWRWHGDTQGDPSFQHSCGGVNWKSLRRATQKRLDELDAHYAGMFD